MKHTDSHRMLEALSDGRRWSTFELAQLGMTPHSRKSDLKKLGYTVEVTRTSTVQGEKDVYFYRLAGVPSWPVLPFENALEEPAGEAIARMRSAGSPASLPLNSESGTLEAANDGGTPDRGRPARALSRPHVERDYEAAPSEIGAPAGGSAPPAAPFSVSGEAGAPPGGVSVQPDVLAEELRGIEDQLAALTADALTFEDVELLEELEKRRDEILTMLSGRQAA